MVSGLSALTDGLADVSSTEVTHVTVLSALLGVLVRLELSTESSDNTLPSVTLRNCNNVRHCTFFKGIGKGNLITETFLRKSELIAGCTAIEANLHDFWDL